MTWPKLCLRATEIWNWSLAWYHIFEIYTCCVVLWAKSNKDKGLLSRIHQKITISRDGLKCLAWPSSVTQTSYLAVVHAHPRTVHTVASTSAAIYKNCEHGCSIRRAHGRVTSLRFPNQAAASIFKDQSLLWFLLGSKNECSSNISNIVVHHLRTPISKKLFPGCREILVLCPRDITGRYQIYFSLNSTVLVLARP